MSQPSHLEKRFLLYWLAIEGQRLALEYRFSNERKWRFDFAHPDSKTAIEIEGGHWSGGRHTRGSGFCKDCEKYNAAALDGWTVFRLTGQMITANGLNSIKSYIERKVKV